MKQLITSFIALNVSVGAAWAQGNECPFDLGYLASDLAFPVHAQSGSLTKSIDSMIEEAGGIDDALAVIDQQIVEIGHVGRQARDNAEASHASIGNGLSEICQDIHLRIAAPHPEAMTYCANNYAYHMMLETNVVLLEARNAIECQRTGRMSHVNYRAAPFQGGKVRFTDADPSESEGWTESTHPWTYLEAQKDQEEGEMHEVAGLFGSLLNGFRSGSVAGNPSSTQSECTVDQSCVGQISDDDAATLSEGLCANASCGVATGKDDRVGDGFNPALEDSKREYHAHAIRVNSCLAEINNNKEAICRPIDKTAAVTKCMEDQVVRGNSCIGAQIFEVYAPEENKLNARIRPEKMSEYVENYNSIFGGPDYLAESSNSNSSSFKRSREFSEKGCPKGSAVYPGGNTQCQPIY